MTIDDVYRLTQYIVAKNQNGYLTPDQFNLVINDSQRQYLDYLLGEYQKYQIRRPVSVVQFGQNERIRQSISPLIYGTVLNINPQGVSPFPSDYEYNDAMWGLYGFYNIKFIQQDRLDSYYHSVIDPIATNPVYLINEAGFQFYPETLGMARMSYVRTPPTMKWAFVEYTPGIPVYDPLNSIDPVWSDTDINNIIARALLMVGINLQAADVIQYGNAIKNTGQ